MSPIEFTVFSTVAGGRGSLVSHDTIAAEAWDDGARPKTYLAIIRLAVCALRRHGYNFRPVYGCGYRMRPAT
jgi:DNA-binding response OmpR family regulator